MSINRLPSELEHQITTKEFAEICIFKALQLEELEGDEERPLNTDEAELVLNRLFSNGNVS